MKRFLALLLTLVMLVSVCGLQAFAADGDMSADTGDELVVYTRSGATRTFHVGDTFSYTYWFRLTSGSVNKITGHVLYDSQCLSVNADGSYQLQAGIMKITAKPEEVALIEETKQQAKKLIERSQHAFRNTPTKAELDLRGMSADEAVATLAVFLDSAMLANLSQVRIIHGKGTGVLRKAVQEELRRNRAVKKFRLGVYGEGEDGVTIAELA